MKKGPKLVLFGLIILLIVALFMNDNTIDVNSKSAIVMDASSGKVLFDKNTKNAYPVASISKLMTEYVVLEKIAASEINWDDQVIISETANDLIDSAAKLPVEANDVLSLEDLFSSMIVASSNNAAIALAEHIAGTEEAFTELMNQKARDIGLSKHTVFVNATGLPQQNQHNIENVMTARDVAKLAKTLLENYEKIVLLKANLPSYYIASHDIEVATTNKLLHENGLDGLKTGFTDAAGYGFVGTAERGGKRLITVVIDAGDEDARFVETKELLDFGFEKKSLPSIKSFTEKVKSIIEKD